MSYRVPGERLKLIFLNINISEHLPIMNSSKIIQFYKNIFVSYDKLNNYMCMGIGITGVGSFCMLQEITNLKHEHKKLKDKINAIDQRLK